MTQRSINNYGYWPDNAEQEAKRKKALDDAVEREDGVTVCPPGYAWGYGWDEMLSEDIL